MTRDHIPIGRFSLITHLSLKALRLYDQRGLLVPQHKDLITGYRSYAMSQISTGVHIRTLSQLGFSLQEMGEILTAHRQGEAERVRDLVIRKQQQIGDEMKRLQHAAEILSRQELSLELIPMIVTEPVIKDIAPIRVMSIREKGTYGETTGRLIGEMFQLVATQDQGPAGLRIAGPVMSIYHDGEYRETDADIEVAVPISGKLNYTGDRIRVSTLSGGKFLSLIYKGPYLGIHEGWSRIYEYAALQGITLGIPGREYYLNDPGEVPESELLTEIQVPVMGEEEPQHHPEQ